MHNRTAVDCGASERIVKMKFMIFLSIIIFFSTEICGSQETNPCIAKETCGKCIQTDPSCAWCSEENFTERCDFVENLIEKNCTELINPDYTKNGFGLELSDRGDSPQSVVQIKPQSLDLAIRPNFPLPFYFEFRQATDYPVDLYYLIDLSPSMKKYQRELRGLGLELGNRIRTISSDFTIGVGSFLDKITSMYSSNAENKFQEAYPPYGFWFNMGLSRKPEIFWREVLNVVKEIDDPQKTSVKADNLTGALDVILQAIVCKDQIKWRPDAKKLIVIATGNEFHYAGDGKLKGIIEPNDGECYNGSVGYYTQKDYPSFSQINRKIKEHNITLIFAVTDDQEDAYHNISSWINGSAARKLTNSSDITQLVEEQYKAISSSIEISDTAQGSGNIEISYNSTCLDNENKRRNMCRNVKPEDTISFNATIQFSKCPEDPTEREKTIEIIPVGRTSKLIVHLKMICDCECGRANNEQNEKFCSGNGIYECGVCRCNNNRCGAQCECEGVENKSCPNISQCKRGKDDRICSNRGECLCGKCVCKKSENPEEMYYGKYCECSNSSCEQVNNKMCNGHGTCDCGKCRCDPGWNGTDCTCSNTTENCLVGSNGLMCSGHGICYCGSCKCDETYYGQFCEDCPYCPGKCEEYGICVKCMMTDEEKPSEEKCNKECEGLKVEFVDKVEVNDTQKEKICSFEDEEGCHIYFKYEKSDNSSTPIHAQRNRECPTPPDIVAIVSGTIGSIVVAGLLLLLLWKFLTYVHDKKEYAKFEKELKDAKWDSVQNPFFVEPTSTFQNPAYRRN